MPSDKFFGKSKEDLVMLATLGRVLTSEKAENMTQEELAAFLSEKDQTPVKKSQTKQSRSKEKTTLPKQKKTTVPSKEEISSETNKVTNAIRKEVKKETPVMTVKTETDLTETVPKKTAKMSKKELNKLLFMQELAIQKEEQSPLAAIALKQPTSTEIAEKRKIETSQKTKLTKNKEEKAEKTKKTVTKNKAETKNKTMPAEQEKEPETSPDKTPVKKAKAKLPAKSIAAGEFAAETAEPEPGIVVEKESVPVTKNRNSRVKAAADQKTESKLPVEAIAVEPAESIKSTETIQSTEAVQSTETAQSAETKSKQEKTAKSGKTQKTTSPAKESPIKEEAKKEESKKEETATSKTRKPASAKKAGKQDETAGNQTGVTAKIQPVEPAEIQPVEPAKIQTGETAEIQTKEPETPKEGITKTTETAKAKESENATEIKPEKTVETKPEKTVETKPESFSIPVEKLPEGIKKHIIQTDKHHRHIAGSTGTAEGEAVQTPEKTEEPAEKPVGKVAAVELSEIVEGALEIMPDGYGFLRKENYLQSPKDIYVPPQYIRRFNLRPGDWISGPGKLQRETDRYQAIMYIKEVNGMSPEKMIHRPHFDRLTPIYPNEKFVLETSRNELSTRIIDLIAPIGKGQRGMIVSPPKAGKTILLQKIANAIAVNNPASKLIVLLIDERPEEVTDMQRSIKGEVVYSTFDKTPENHVKVVELVLERAMRLVELGQDVVILLDSITRLARAYNLTITPTGRTLSGGLDPGALYGPKRFFGAARNIENGGSLTIIATSLIETGSRMDEVIFEEFKGTGNMEVYLDRKLSEKRIFPAIDINRSGTRREELLLTKRELDAVWTIRKAFSQLDTAAVTEMIINLLLKTNHNNHFVSSVNVSLNDKAVFDAMRGTKPGSQGNQQSGNSGNQNESGRNF